MNPQLTPGQLDDLERLIDRHGIATVLFAIADIASLKASHVAEQWQDAALAKRWHRVGHLIAKYPADAAIGL